MISKFFIERPIFANVIAIVTIILGMVCFYILPVSQYPPIVPPTIQVTTRYPGASAEVVAATVGIPIEQAVNGVEESIYLSSTSASDGSYTLTITFNVGTDLNTSVALVQNLVNSALAQFPVGASTRESRSKRSPPIFCWWSASIRKTDKFDETFLSNYGVINLQNPLARLPGVGQIRVVGAGPYSMRVWLDPNKLHYYNLTTMDVVSAIQGQNVQVVAGQIGRAAGAARPGLPIHRQRPGPAGRRGAVREHHHQEPPRAESAQIVRIRDVARVELSQQSYSNFAGDQRPQGRADPDLYLARGQRPGGRRRSATGHGGDEQRLSARPELRDSLRHHEVCPSRPYTTSTRRFSRPASWFSSSSWYFCRTGGPPWCRPPPSR